VLVNFRNAAGAKHTDYWRGPPTRCMVVGLCPAVKFVPRQLRRPLAVTTIGAFVPGALLSHRRDRAIGQVEAVGQQSVRFGSRPPVPPAQAQPAIGLNRAARFHHRATGRWSAAPSPLSGRACRRHQGQHAAIDDHAAAKGVRAGRGSTPPPVDDHAAAEGVRAPSVSDRCPAWSSVLGVLMALVTSSTSAPLAISNRR